MRVVAERLLDGLVAVAGLGDDLEVGLGVEDDAQPAQDDRVVVGDQDARLEWGHVVLARTWGMVSWTWVPPAGGEVMVRPAPISIARSRMPRMPCAEGSDPGARPRPSSATVRTVAWSWCSSRRSTVVASAWRATLVRASWATR